MVLAPLRRCLWLAPLLGLLAAVSPAPAQTAHILNEAGPINTSMAGASTALPLDASSAMFWNPATLSGLRQSEADFGFETILPHSRLSSSYPANALAPGAPPVPLSGTSTDYSLVPVPNFAVVYKEPDSPLTYGLSAHGLAGFRLNYGSNPANPINSPQPPLGIGFGALYVDYEVLQLAPEVAYQVNERWSVGLGPTVDLASVAANPFPFTPPSFVDGAPVYPSALAKDYAWGAGFQAGVYYSGPEGIHWGLSVKSPQWFQDFHIKSEDPQGRPIRPRFDLDYPLLVTTGLAYTGLEHFQFALDLRYLNYKDTNGFSHTGFDAQGALRGLGWNDVFIAAFGVQYAPSGPLSYRLGYSFNTNPIPSENASYNLASPSVNEHTLYCGLSYTLTENWVMSLAYGHGFTNTISGPLQTPAGPVPGTVLKSVAGADAIVVGLNVRF